jgi:hypothetical protein
MARFRDQGTKAIMGNAAKIMTRAARQRPLEDHLLENAVLKDEDGSISGGCHAASASWRDPTGLMGRHFTGD